jgi:hypothetical protein
MKFALPLAALAGLAACATSPSDPGREPDHVTKLRLEIERDKTKMVGLYNELTRKYMDMEKRTVSLENLVAIYQVEINRLKKEVEMAGAGTKQQPVNPPDPKELPIKTEEARLKAELALNDLQKGLKIEDIIAEMKPIASVSTIVFADALSKHATDFDFLKKLETVLAAMPAKSLEIPLQEAVKDRRRRNSAAQIVGETKDLALSRILEPYTADPDDYFCYLVGGSLLKCKNRQGVPALLRPLRSDDKQLRMLTIKALKEVNGNNAFGYDWSKDSVENASAIKTWHDWWDKDGKKLWE